MLPKSFDNSFTDHKSIHGYNTRNKNNYRLSIHKIESVFSTGPKYWNNLPDVVKNSKNISQFKTQISKYIQLYCS